MRKGIAVTAKKIMILPDAHFPHQDNEALACVEAAVAVIDPDEIVVLGDWLDAGGFSRHNQWSFDDGTHSYLADEVAPCNDFLDVLQGRKDRKVVYLEGNHEARVEKFFVNEGRTRSARDLNRLASPERCLRYRIDANGDPGSKRKHFKWVPYVGKGVHSHHKIAPDLVAIHGWSFAEDFNRVNEKSAPSVSVVCGHVHRAASRTTRDSITGQVKHYWSPGCLSELVPLYMANSPHNWTHGFTIVYKSRRRPRDWTPEHVVITNGRAILPDGREVSA